MSTIAGRQRYWGLPPVGHGSVDVLDALTSVRAVPLPTVVVVSGLGLLVAALAIEIQFAWATVSGPWFASFGFADLGGYLDGARRFVATGSPYLPSQVAGPWQLGAHSFIHPPTALPLFLAFLVLPAPLWWAIPLGATAWVVRQLRPAGWALALMAVALLWPRSVGSLLAGNSDMWAMALVAVGVRYGPGPLLLAIKPTFAPLALAGMRRRAWWIAAGTCCVAVAATLPLWVQYVAVIRGAGLPLTYSVWNLPLVCVPLLAWAGRSGALGRATARRAAAR